jgi:hypothetical protein
VERPRLRAKPVEFVWAMQDVAFGREPIIICSDGTGEVVKGRKAIFQD